MHSPPSSLSPGATCFKEGGELYILQLEVFSASHRQSKTDTTILAKMGQSLGIFLTEHPGSLTHASIAGNTPF